MIKLRIDNQEVKVPENTSVMQAAESVGIDIPSMCFMEGFTNHPSCMVCMVKDTSNGKLFASCAMPVAEGMELVTQDEEVAAARREALELLLADHVGDCEAPCRNGCPAFMDIPLMNRLIAEGRFREALMVVKEEISLPLILGTICEAPCEKVCRRRPIDEAVSICRLKEFVAAEDYQSGKPYIPEKNEPSGKRVAVVGSGPAGLSAAFHLLKSGHQAVVFDKNKTPGGSLNQLDKKTFPPEVLKQELDFLSEYGAEFILNTLVDAEKLEDQLLKEFDAVLLATGHVESSENKRFGVLFDAKGFLVSQNSSQTNLPGVYACGSAVRKQKMAVRAVAQGKEAAWEIDRFFGGAGSRTKKMFNSRFGKLEPDEYPEYMKEAQPHGRIAPSKGVLTGYMHQEAMQEAVRCMHCDCRKKVSCRLRIYADVYQADRKKYAFDKRKPVEKQFNHKNIVYEPEKCIKCGLCVEIASADKELTGLSFIGRGFDVRVEVPFSRTLEQALTKSAARCAEACPTGAIAFREAELEKDIGRLIDPNNPACDRV